MKGKDYLFLGMICFQNSAQTTEHRREELLPYTTSLLLFET